MPVCGKSAQRRCVFPALHVDVLEPINDAKRGFVTEAERIRLQGVQLEIGCFVPQAAEFRPERKMGSRRYIDARAIQKHAFRLRPDTCRRSRVNGHHSALRIYGCVARNTNNGSARGRRGNG